MKILRFFGLILLAAILFFGMFLIYASLTYYNPDPVLPISEAETPDTIPCESTINIMSWNIGYAGLGDNMDFFYDNGEKVRDTYERTAVNLDSISSFLTKNLNNSFILLQEVDLEAKRSYSINEVDTLINKTKFNYAFAPNYVAKFVPIPPTNPLGGVYSGILSLSTYTHKSSTRYGYPGAFSWPNRLFNLRRCMLVSRYPTDNGKEFVLINTHKSAFDDGSLKKQEMAFLQKYILDEYSKGNFIVVGGDWNQSPPNFSLNTFGENPKVDFFILANIDSTFMPQGWKWIYDKSSPTNRYLNEPYIQDKTFRSILDFFLVSPNIEVVDNRTFDLNFNNSDHNPITMSFKLIR
ncbi:MAG: endonuclease/exonuclease/phosphatase family protein [Tenuifilaceae bacterium]